MSKFAQFAVVAYVAVSFVYISSNLLVWYAGTQSRIGNVSVEYQP